ncbi:membrane protein [Tamlana sedimentorum]|uniref:Membrane protein n=1 Tax=Neotamlana sedimentorum TaxID=1435349 RepID=A0A0D7W1T6_9FLAO|nr:TonB-dependent receptor [Tamlana sedimentorum]KJD32668.1 membrane protein [Tamlana sedimentorum]
MKLNKECFNIVLIISLLSFNAFAQERLPLIRVLNQLEENFDVKFSYSENDIDAVFIEKPNSEASLQSIIDGLNDETLLNFKILDERYITISSINKTINICGIVLSETDSFPLIGATVQVVNTQKGVITNSNGDFKLKDVPVNSIIEISYLGFEAVQIKAIDLRKTNQSVCSNIVLAEKAEALNKILISKFLTTGLQKRVDGSTVLNTEKFGTLPGLTEPDVLQSIQALPGVESVNESIANINVRGGTNGQNLMIWDGIKMYHSGHFFGLISAYNPYLTEKVEVTKNGTSSEFSDGVSSTINMFTKNNIDETVSGGFGVNLLHADGYLQIPLSKKLAVHVSGRRAFTDAFSSPTYNQYFEKSFQDSELTTNSENISDAQQSSDFFFYDYSGKIVFDVNEKHKLRANVIGIYNNLDYTESFENSDGETESKTSNLKQENSGFGGSWNADWTNRFSTEISGFYSKYNVDALNYRVETDQSLTQANEVLETGIKLKNTIKLNKTINVLAGYAFNEIGVLYKTTVSAPSYDRITKDVLLNHGAFTEIEYNKNNTYLRLGVRGNYFQKFNSFLVEPRLNLRQKLSNQFALKLQGEFKNQTTKQKIDFQDDFLGVENRRWTLANEQLIKISKSKQVSFGFEFNKNNWLFDVESFYKIVDGITASNQGFYNNFQYENANGNYKARGLEFLVNKTATKYSTWLSYTFSKNDYEFETITPSVFPNNLDIRHSVSLAFNYNILKNLEASVGGIWRSGQPYTQPVEGNETIQDGNATVVNYDTPNHENVEDFMRVDASLNSKFTLSNKVQGQFRLGVLNLLNRNNTTNRYFELNSENSNETLRVDNQSLGITPNASLRITF